MDFQDFLEKNKLTFSLDNFGKPYGDLTHRQQEFVNDSLGTIYIDMVMNGDND